MTDSIDATAILKRRILWDCLPCWMVSSSFQSHGLLPPSDSGHAVEHRDSHRRLNRLAPLYEELLLHASLAGEVLGRAILESQGNEDVEVGDPRIQQFRQLVQAGSMAVLAGMLDTGSVEIGEPL